MIRVQKAAEPAILTANKAQWTHDLQQKIADVGDYSHLTKANKDAYVNHYKHDDIHAALRNGRAVERCVYCERDITTGDKNVEHYHPKSIYSSETFEWDNLFSACLLCNRAKGSFDTGVEPFIHPVNDDPEEYLSYDGIVIRPRYRATTSQMNYDKGKNVIEKCKLYRSDLYYGLADVMVRVSEKANELKAMLEKYAVYVRIDAQERMAREIMAKLNGIKVLARGDKENAGFARECLRQNVLVQEAVKIVNRHTGALGLGVAGYDWGWNYYLMREI